MPVSRRAVVAAAALAPLASRFAQAAEPLIRRPIPSSGEMLPAIGIGTSRRYEVEPTPDNVAPLREAVRSFVTLGGTVIDTAPSYGTAEDVLGAILSEPGLRQKIFLASKVDTTGHEATRAEFERSLTRMKVETLDLVAVHNLIDVADNLALLRDLKSQKRIRYVGVTVWRDNQLEALEAVMKRETLDFIQVNYAIDNRAAAERVIPLAAERGMAVMTNVPFGRDRLFKAVQGKDLPPVAKDLGCASWPQFFLKYVLGNPAVTCPIPGMAKASYVADNLGAARGALPGPAQRKQMESFIDAV
ncbi:aldo/keto reductase [Methylobacterium sp. J-026]|uniref:aldo/keto reductase n=1 Tax=Methylobacterium sp. J-026 TaxID=2836624 RepID=UPI001FB9B807|nr:aldo/keto reductase [Methylobacterium sp. J-026]MCJ2133558.1 aldo/keto reductase [Methylobacterium sp. J-026]